MVLTQWNKPDTTLVCRNLRSSLRDHESVTALVHKELEKEFVIGPFQSSPFDIYRISPLGVAIGKYSGKKRLIVDLSAPHDHPDHSSINDLIDKESCSLTYVKIDDAIKLIQQLGRGAKMCKADISDAFKLIPVRPDQWPLFGFIWNKQLYFYTRLAFGCRSSPKIFDTLSQAICWIATNNYGITNILHLLDDFLTVDAPDYSAERTMALIYTIFARLNIPLAKHKTMGPLTVIEYLGIILDSDNMVAKLPQDKIDRITAFIQSLLNKKSCTKLELLQLLDHLNFATRVIRAGRAGHSCHILSLCQPQSKNYTIM